VPFTAHLRGFAEPFALRRMALGAESPTTADLPALIAV
jgi:hypothetical protein